jgi:hypothetical protein
MREAVTCRQFCHPNIIGFLGVRTSETDKLYSLVTPFMKNGNVVEFTQHHPNVNRLTLVGFFPSLVAHLTYLSPGLANYEGLGVFTYL